LLGWGPYERESIKWRTLNKKRTFCGRNGKSQGRFGQRLLLETFGAEFDDSGVPSRES